MAGAVTCIRTLPGTEEAFFLKEGFVHGEANVVESEFSWGDSESDTAFSYSLEVRFLRFVSWWRIWLR